MNQALSQALYAAIYKLLRPLAALLLRRGMSYNEFAEIAKRAYIDAATEEFPLPNRKQSLSRVSVLTGINRKEIARLEKLPNPIETGETQSANRSSRVVNGWIRDIRFQDEHGAPLTLPLDEGDNSFTELVRLYGGDVPVRAVLDELIRLDSVEVSDHGEAAGKRVALKVEGYVPQTDLKEKLRIMSTAVADLLRTIDHNLEADRTEARVQRTVAYNDIPMECLEAIRGRSKEEVEEILQRINRWLSGYDRGVNAKLQGSGKFRAGIGVYYFEQSLTRGEQP
ncbi:conserved hypothetical protein [Hahella chejuensis KCTC 2396]|uniref:Uncharacterized protein n=1 Tax=Hahella chejuensis (strain KCTC 2396) TaxID=349521 RepID=Q2SEL9_HAHCH|nr:DUF6502 family protein [Hahella chejuensis]ABC30905.1 conserved hypothetical protein [Hahella chejuensis KCTC 2396]